LLAEHTPIAIDPAQELLNQICECKVKVIELQDQLELAINECSIFIKNTAELCSQIIQETGLEGFENKNTFESDTALSNAMIIYTMYSNAAFFQTFYCPMLNFD
jgi:hypothetical protein